MSVKEEPVEYQPPALLETEVLEPTVVAPTLTVTEQEELARCEETIRRGWQSFVEVGEALNRIHDKKLYRDRYERFEDYYRAEWQYQKSQVYRLMGAAKVVRALSPSGEKPDEGSPLPLSEAQVRPLVGLDETEIKRLWRQTVEEAAGQPITARLVQRQVSATRPATTQSTNRPRSSRPKYQPDHFAEITRLLDELVELTAKDAGERKRAEKLKKQILRLVQSRSL